MLDGCKCSVHGTPYMTDNVLALLLCCALQATKDAPAGMPCANVTAALPPVDPLNRFLAFDRVQAWLLSVSEVSAPQCCHMVRPQSCS